MENSFLSAESYLSVMAILDNLVIVPSSMKGLDPSVPYQLFSFHWAISTPSNTYNGVYSSHNTQVGVGQAI